jgi:UDP-GlcNAc3NAcA epimerase
MCGAVISAAFAKGISCGKYLIMKVVTIVGARPQFVKAAPVSRALAEASNLQEVLVHTGQHFDPAMSDVFFAELSIPRPAYNLEVNSLGHGAMTGRMLEKIEQVLIAEKPGAVLIYGDTNSTVAGALAAAKLQIPVAHVEAGLRSFNRRMPEEVNRVMADHVSELLLCPTKTAVANLANEGITRGVHHVGDVMYDVAIEAVRRARNSSRILDAHHLAPRTYAVSTIHRAENTNDRERFRRILEWLAREAERQPVVMPVHPRTRRLIAEMEIALPNVSFVDPLGYLDMAWLVHNAAAVFTDSGGLQKEAYFHRVPCVTLRDETEWVETISAGWNRLWTEAEEARERQEIPDYGQGGAAQEIVKLLGPAFQGGAAGSA